MSESINRAGPDPGLAKPPGFDGASICQALDSLSQASRDLAFTEMAEVIACNRLSSLDDMIEGCRSDMDIVDGAEYEALENALTVLGEERASLAATLPLELAFRADQRDLATGLFVQAQADIRAWFLEHNHHPEAGLLSDEKYDSPIIEQAKDALKETAQGISISARAEAQARFEDWNVVDLHASATRQHPSEVNAASIARGIVAEPGAGRGLVATPAGQVARHEKTRPCPFAHARTGTPAMKPRGGANRR